MVLDWRCMPVVYAYEKESDLHQSIHPQGFYDVRCLTPPSDLPLASCGPPVAARHASENGLNSLVLLASAAATDLKAGQAG